MCFACRGIAFVVGWLILAGSACAAPSVELELIMSPDFPPTEAQGWLESLQGLKLGGLRIRSGDASERPEVKVRGSEAAPSYQVTGVLLPGNTVRLPGGTFRRGDRGIANWFAKLQDGGVEGVTGTTSAFGLLPKQLVGLHEKLATKVTFATQGEPTISVARKIVAAVGLPVSVDGAAQKILAGEIVVGNDLQGLSSGTALAAALRPAGLVMVPEKQAGNTIRLRIVEARAAKEAWPVGWPAEKPPKDLAPELFKFLNVEITDVALPDALSAVQQRLSFPILLDHAALAKHDIDPARIKVSLPTENTYYKKILDRVLFQARLKGDLLVDESGKPFLWITSIKK